MPIARPMPEPRCPPAPVPTRRPSFVPALVPSPVPALVPSPVPAPVRRRSTRRRAGKARSGKPLWKAARAKSRAVAKFRRIRFNDLQHLGEEMLVDYFNTLNRKQLQRVAKKIGVKANMTSNAIREEAKRYFLRRGN